MIRHSGLPDAQTAGWAGIVDGSLLLVRTYADGSLTAAVNDGHRYGPEVELTAEAVEGR